MIPKHCSDERLLAWLDGEQSFLSAAMTRRHLQSCWECRARVAQLEAAALQLSEARRRTRFLPEERVEAARARVMRKMELREQTSVSLLWKRVPVYGLFGGICLAGVVGLYEAWKPAPVAEPRPVVVMKRAAPPAEAPLAVHVAPTKARPAPPPVSAPVESMPVVVHTARDGDAAMVWSVLHELGLCRERAVRVEEQDGRLRLTGVVPSTNVRESLRVRFGTLGIAVELGVAAVDEVVAAEATPLTAERVVRVHAPGEGLLVEWLQSQGVAARDAAARSGEIANASVLVSELAWGEAWAIRDLAGRFGGVWREMPDTARGVVLSMLRDHWSELQTMAARQRRLIGGILPAAAAPAGDLFPVMEGWARAAQDLFAPAKPVEEAAGVLTGRIAAALAGVEGMAGDDAALVELLESKRLRAGKGK